MANAKKKLIAVSNDAQDVIHRMAYIQSVISTFEDSDDLMSIENALRAAASDVSYMIDKVMNLYDEVED